MNVEHEVKVLRRSVWMSVGVAAASVGFLLRKHHDYKDPARKMSPQGARNIGIAVISGTFAISHVAVCGVLYASTDVFNQ